MQDFLETSHALKQLDKIDDDFRKFYPEPKPSTSGEYLNNQYVDPREHWVRIMPDIRPEPGPAPPPPRNPKGKKKLKGNG